MPKSKYMAPELSEFVARSPNKYHDSSIDHLEKADSWALGCLLYELAFKEVVDQRKTQASL